MRKILILISFLLICLTPFVVKAWTTLGVGQTVADEGGGISDNFSIDCSGATCTNYTSISGTLTIADGYALGSSWANSFFYHKTSLSSVDHYVQATVNKAGTDDGGAVLARCDGTHYYYAAFSDNDKINLYRDSTLLDTYDCGSNCYMNGTYTLKLDVSGSGATVTITVSVDGTERINYDDTNAARLTTGNYIGLGSLRGGDNANSYVDDLVGN